MSAETVSSIVRSSERLRSDATATDFVISFQPEDLIVFRHAEARALRKACLFLRWEVVSDTVPEADNMASW